MTAIRQRRTRSMVLSLVAAVVGLAAAAVLGVAGMRTLADSTAGQQAGGERPVVVTQRLPFTATALMGVVDDTGRLTSSVAMALEPDGTGGSIIGLAATADAGSGATGELEPLASVLAVSGPSAYLEAAERATGLSFDVVEIVDQDRFARLVSPLGELPTDLPIPLTDASTGETWEEGESVLTGPGAARIITASDPAVADWSFEPARAAIWAAIADRVGAGIGSAEPVSSDDDLTVPVTLDQFVDRLFADRVGFRALAFVPIDDERVATELPAELVNAFGPMASDGVVAHDRAEVLMVVGSVAPSRLGAPLEAPTYRVVSGYDDAELDDLGLNRADVLKQALDRLLFVQVNVVSVADLPGESTPDVTQLVVADAALVETDEDTYDDLFGGVEVQVRDVVIDGVDVEVRLGRAFLEELRGDSSADVAGSGE